MKLIFASDLHGSACDAQCIKDIFYKEKADKLVLCGDLLYHGPRNDLPEDYNPKRVIEILNSVAGDIIAVRGNCDSEVDQMVLDFPITADYVLIYAESIRIYVTHGHIYNSESPMKLKENDVLVCGHTHIMKAERCNGFYHINPGSAALPKNGNPKTYMVYENKCFTIKTLDGAEVLNIKPL